MRPSLIYYRETETEQLRKDDDCATASAQSVCVCVYNRAWSQTFLKCQSDQSSPSCDGGTSPVHSIPAAAAAKTSSPHLSTCWAAILQLNRKRCLKPSAEKNLLLLTRAAAEWLQCGCLSITLLFSFKRFIFQSIATLAQSNRLTKTFVELINKYKANL